MHTTLRFLADMNVSPLTVNALSSEGWATIRVSNVLAANASDATILAFARQYDYVIITQDLDFSTLLALGGFERPSVITLRLKDTAPEIVTARLKSVLAEISESLDKGCAVTVDDRSLRIRYLPIR